MPIFKKVKNPIAPFKPWSEDAKIKCLMQGFPQPPRSELKWAYEAEKNKEIYENDFYVLKVSREAKYMPHRAAEPRIRDIIGNHIIWCEINRKDGLPVTSWEDKQAIKDFVGGETKEGVELFPAKKRLMTDGNICHLWILKEDNDFFPFGYMASPELLRKQAQKENAKKKTG